MEPHAFQHGCRGPIRFLGGIVVFADMAQIDMSKPLMPDLAYRIRAFVIARMPVTSAYPLLQFGRIWSVCEHFAVIVRLYHKRVCSRGAVQSLIGQSASVCNEHKCMPCHTDVIPHCM